MGQIKMMDVAEFRREGYLQEVNRLLLHPCGLALEVTAEAAAPLRRRPFLALRTGLRAARDVLLGRTAGERLSGVWDYREDPEGMAYGHDPDGEKATRVGAQWRSKRAARSAALGFHVQPAAEDGILRLQMPEPS